jgi:hypothetical protein
MKKLGRLLPGLAIVLCAGVARSDADGDTARRALVAAADDAVGVMALRGDHVQQWLREARAKRYKRRAACLDDHLSQVHAVERLARAELGWLSRAVQRDVPDEALRARARRVELYAARSRDLLADAKACSGRLSRRQRVPTGYEVRLREPPLPPPD